MKEFTKALINHRVYVFHTKCVENSKRTVRVDVYDLTDLKPSDVLNVDILTVLKRAKKLNDYEAYLLSHSIEKKIKRECMKSGSLNRTSRGQERMCAIVR